VNVPWAVSVFGPTTVETDAVHRPSIDQPEIPSENPVDAPVQAIPFCHPAVVVTACVSRGSSVRPG
jgi:hypothetical protein